MWVRAYKQIYITSYADNSEATDGIYNYIAISIVMMATTANLRTLVLIVQQQNYDHVDDNSC